MIEYDITLLVLTVLPFLSGCVSLQIPTANGPPKLIGLGHVRTINCQAGQIVEISAPGLSMRAYGDAPGISLGWHDTRLFYPAFANEEQPRQPIAIQTRCVGIDLALDHVMVGYDNTFSIPLSACGTQAVQLIEYTENNPTNAVIEQKEIE